MSTNCSNDKVHKSSSKEELDQLCGYITRCAFPFLSVGTTAPDYSDLAAAVQVLDDDDGSAGRPASGGSTGPRRDADIGVYDEEDDIVII